MQLEKRKSNRQSSAWVAKIQARGETPSRDCLITDMSGGAFGFWLRGAESLEPVSKSPEEDNEAGELHKAQEVLSEDTALPLDPLPASNGPFGPKAEPCGYLAIASNSRPANHIPPKITTMSDSGLRNISIRG